MLETLTGAGLTVGDPMACRTDGRTAPRRGLDAQERDVVVHLLDLPAGPQGARVLRRLAGLRALRHPGLARVRQVVPLPGEQVAVSVDLVAGADLAVVLGARGALTRSEAARLLDDVGSALAYMHAAGLSHGDVSPGNVMVTAEGGAVLIDLLGGVMETGTRGCAAPERRAGGPASAASDVYAMASLLRLCSEGSATLRQRLDRVLADCLDDDPAARPSMRAFTARAGELAHPGAIELPDGARLAAGALRAAAAVPTQLAATRQALRHVPGSAPAWQGSRRRRTGAARSRRSRHDPRAAGATRIRDGEASSPVQAVLVTALLVAAGGAVALGALNPGEPSSASAETRQATALSPSEVSSQGGTVPALPEGADASPVPESTVLLEAVSELAARRDEALVALDHEALARTTVEGSPAALADESLLASLEAAGERPGDLDTVVSAARDVELASADLSRWVGARAVLVTQSQGVSTRWGLDGQARTVPAPAVREVVLVLVPGPWRVAEVREVG